MFKKKFTNVKTKYTKNIAWVVYGSVILDSFVLVPNLIGLVAAVIQLYLIILYPKIPHDAETLPQSVDIVVDAHMW